MLDQFSSKTIENNFRSPKRKLVLFLWASGQSTLVSVGVCSMHGGSPPKDCREAWLHT